MKVLALILLVLFILIAFFGAISCLIMASKTDDDLLDEKQYDE